VAVKEVQLGLAADVGTLQRMPKVMGSESLLRELAYTGRDFSAAEALEFGFVSRVFDDRAALCGFALQTAQEIAANSPIAVVGTKR
jgi:delta(3,5)-delta(2,4)-dienoyl-CoA isomerase